MTARWPAEFARSVTGILTPSSRVNKKYINHMCYVLKALSGLIHRARKKKNTPHKDEELNSVHGVYLGVLVPSFCAVLLNPCNYVPTHPNNNSTDTWRAPLISIALA